MKREEENAPPSLRPMRKAFLCFQELKREAKGAGKCAGLGHQHPPLAPPPTPLCLSLHWQSLSRPIQLYSPHCAAGVTRPLQSRGGRRMALVPMFLEGNSCQSRQWGEIIGWRLKHPRRATVALLRRAPPGVSWPLKPTGYLCVNKTLLLRFLSLAWLDPRSCRILLGRGSPVLKQKVLSEDA